MSSSGRLFPQSTRLDVDGGYRVNKVVDKSNPYAGLSARKSPSRVNTTTLHEDVRPRSTGRAGRAPSTDPFDGNRRDLSSNQAPRGIRATGMEAWQQERSKFLQDNPRPLRRCVSPDTNPVDHSRSVFTARGELVRGRKGPEQYPQSQIVMNSGPPTSDDAARQCQRARSSERFKNTPHTNTSHTIVPDMSAGVGTPARTMVRFSGRERTPTLHGVLYPVQERQPPSYRVRAPFYTED